ncbi:unnamed protein product, partial [Heterotrigona itama]
MCVNNFCRLENETNILAVCLLLTAADADVSLGSSERSLNTLFHLE